MKKLLTPLMAFALAIVFTACQSFHGLPDGAQLQRPLQPGAV